RPRRRQWHPRRVTGVFGDLRRHLQLPTGRRFDDEHGRHVQRSHTRGHRSGGTGRVMMMGNRDWLFQQEARKPRAVGETLGRFWSYFRQYSFVLVLEALLIISSTYLQVIVPNLIGQAVDCYLAPATQSGATVTSDAHCWFATLPATATTSDYVTGLAGLVGLIVVIFIVSSLLTGLQFYLMTFMGQKVLRTLREQVFAQIHRLS